jgi:hypothetical protein
MPIAYRNSLHLVDVRSRRKTFAVNTGEAVRSIYVAYNGWSGFVTANLPAPAPGMAWYRACDTDAWDEPNDNCTAAGNEDPLVDPTYAMHPRSLLVLVER